MGWMLVLQIVILMIVAAALISWIIDETIDKINED
jgi:preprotein translocase subunit SecE